MLRNVLVRKQEKDRKPFMSHFRVSFGVAGRSAGHSAAKRSAYQLCARGHGINGAVYDFRHKQAQHRGTEMLVPLGAPAWTLDSAEVWARAAKSEKRIDAQEARLLEIAIPRGIPEELHGAFLRYTFQPLADAGMIMQLDRHRERATDGGWNDHGHGEVTLRELDASTDTGFSKSKARQWNEMFRDGDGRTMRNMLADRMNQFCVDHGITDVHLDARSLKAQGIDRDPEPAVARWKFDAQREGRPQVEIIDLIDYRAAIAELEAAQCDVAALQSEFLRTLSPDDAIAEKPDIIIEGGQAHVEIVGGAYAGGSAGFGAGGPARSRSGGSAIEEEGGAATSPTGGDPSGSEFGQIAGSLWRGEADGGDAGGPDGEAAGGHGRRLGSAVCADLRDRVRTYQALHGGDDAKIDRLKKLLDRVQQLAAPVAASEPVVAVQHRKISLVPTAGEDRDARRARRRRWLAATMASAYDLAWVTESQIANITRIDVDTERGAIILLLASGTRLVDRMDRIDIVGTVDEISVDEITEAVRRRGWDAVEITGGEEFRIAAARRLCALDPPVHVVNSPLTEFEIAEIKDAKLPSPFFPTAFTPEGSDRQADPGGVGSRSP